MKKTTASRFAVTHVPADPTYLFDDEELVEVGYSTDAERLFFRAVLDHGIRLTATCDDGQGVRLDLDISRWAARLDPNSSWFYTVKFERSLSRDGPFDPIASIQSDLTTSQFSFFDRTVMEGVSYHYRAFISYFDYDYGSPQNPEISPYSNYARPVLDCPLPGGAFITANCFDNRIVVNWARPRWATEGNDISPTYYGWKLMRATDPNGPYTWINQNETPHWNEAGMFVDPAVTLGVTYYYYVQFTYFDMTDWQTEYTGPDSNIVSASLCSAPPYLGPMDIAFIVDNTMSLGAVGALQKLKEQSVVDSLLDAIEQASGGSYRLALVTTDTDSVNVRQPFVFANRALFKAALIATNSMSGGENFEESTDECLNTVVNGLGAAGRPKQTGDFHPPFGLDADNNPFYRDPQDDPIVPLKMIVLITDDLPGGFEDQYTEAVRADAILYATQARGQNIRINSISVGGHSLASELMLEYADITCGWFSALPDNADNISEAIHSIFGVPLICLDVPLYLQ